VFGVRDRELFVVQMADGAYWDSTVTKNGFDDVMYCRILNMCPFSST
jgi:hypothetical protein